jgi:hypothetical protein
MKRQLLEGYLRQQRAMQGPTSSYAPTVASSVNEVQRAPPPSNTGGELVLIDTNNIPENITLEEFKNYVKKWLDLDNTIKKVQEAVREKKKQRDTLSNVISQFMAKYNIEDLNTKEGRIRCKVSVVKAPLNQKVVKQKISDYFRNDESKKEEILSTIYEDRPKTEKLSLRRLKIS